MPMKRTCSLAAGVAALWLTTMAGSAQAPQPPASARQLAPVDLVGTWVSVVSEDWRWRMVTPPRGDFQSIPLTLAGQKLTEAWDPARDERAGELCKAYGPPGMMRLPTRLRVSWQDDSTLKIETDYGTQTRLFHFLPQPRSPRPTLQGDSVAQWEIAGRRGGGAARAGGAPPQRFGSLKVVTSGMRPGYLRKNGVPYSGNAVVTEFFDLNRLPNGDQWLVDTMVVHDPEFLQVDWITSLNFRKEPDGSKWDPTPCSAR